MIPTAADQMKKSNSLSDDARILPSFDDGVGAAMPAPAAANNGLIFDDGEPFALAYTTTGSTSSGTAKPVATIATCYSHREDCPTALKILGEAQAFIPALGVSELNAACR